MPIKKSTLEQKASYRIAKVIFGLLPFIVAGIYFAVQKNIYDFVACPQQLSKLSDVSLATLFKIGPCQTVSFVIIGLILYFVILALIWRIAIYLIFGGVENDLLKNTPAGAQADPKASARNNGLALFLIIIVIIIFALFYYSQAAPSPNNNKKNTNNYTVPNNNVPNKVTPHCVPTGCGALWYCSGTYYLNGVSRNITGCFPTGARPSELLNSWSGSCRQCP